MAIGSRPRSLILRCGRRLDRAVSQRRPGSLPQGPRRATWRLASWAWRSYPDIANGPRLIIMRGCTAIAPIVNVRRHPADAPRVRPRAFSIWRRPTFASPDPERSARTQAFSAPTKFSENYSVRTTTCTLGSRNGRRSSAPLKATCSSGELGFRPSMVTSNVAISRHFKSSQRI